MTVAGIDVETRTRNACLGRVSGCSGAARRVFRVSGKRPA